MFQQKVKIENGDGRLMDSGPDFQDFSSTILAARQTVIAQTNCLDSWPDCQDFQAYELHTSKMKQTDLNISNLVEHFEFRIFVQVEHFKSCINNVNVPAEPSETRINFFESNLA